MTMTRLARTDHLEGITKALHLTVDEDGAPIEFSRRKSENLHRCETSLAKKSDIHRIYRESRFADSDRR